MPILGKDKNNDNLRGDETLRGTFCTCVYDKLSTHERRHSSD